MFLLFFCIKLIVKTVCTTCNIKTNQINIRCLMDVLNLRKREINPTFGHITMYLYKKWNDSLSKLANYAKKNSLKTICKYKTLFMISD